MPLPQLKALGHLQIIIVIIIIIDLGIPSRSIDLSGILSHLQLEVLRKPDKLFMLCDSGLNVKRRQC